MYRQATIVCLLTLLTGCGAAEPFERSTEPPTSNVPLPIDAMRIARLVHDRVNQVRSHYDLSTLAWNRRLLPVAQNHSGDMSARRYFSHLSPDGTTPAQRYVRSGYRCRVSLGRGHFLVGGENIYRGHRVAVYEIDHLGRKSPVRYRTEANLADRIVAGWLASPSHRDNLLKPAWRTEAIGVVVDRAGEVWVTQNFC